MEIDKEKTIDYAYEVICKIKEESEAIKSHLISQLINTNTLQETGFAVVVELNNKFGYTDSALNNWKERLHADQYIVKIEHNQLIVKFIIHYS